MHLALHNFIFSSTRKKTDKLHQFKKKEDSFLFVISIVGYGAPVCGTSYLISFLNVGERLASSREIYLTFGTDEDE